MLALRNKSTRLSKTTPLQEATLHCDKNVDQTGLKKEFISNIKGYGIFAAKPFLKGSFLLEYCGQQLVGKEIEKKELEYSERRKQKYQRCYVYHFKYGQQKMCIDATVDCGRLGRFVNDAPEGSIDCNSVMKRITLKNCPRLVLFATRNIDAGEEIAYDYGEVGWWRNKEIQAKSLKLKGKRKKTPPERADKAKIKCLLEHASVCKDNKKPPDVVLDLLTEELSTDIINFSADSTAACNDTSEIPDLESVSNTTESLGIIPSDTESLGFVPPSDTESLGIIAPDDSDMESLGFSPLNQESNNIVIQTVQNGGSRDYKKRHNCYFCNTLQSRIARHLTLKHRDIKEIATLPDPSEEDKMSIASKTKRRIVLNKYRNLGNFCHNVEVLKNKKGVLFVGRRPKKDMCNKPENYLPCQHCFQFFVCSELWRHTRHCMFKQTPLDYENLEQEKEAAKEAIKCGKMLIHGATGAGATGFEIDNCKFQTLVLDSLKTDEVGLAIKSDELLILFGKSQFSKLGSSRASQVREKLRILARLKIILRARTGMCSSPIQDFIDSQHFDTCIVSVNVLADDSTDRSLSGTKMYRNPSIALKAGHLLKKLAGLKKGQALRAKDFDSKTAALEFLDLYQSEWTDRVSGIASQNLSERQFNRKEVLPITEDVMNLSKHLEQKLKDCTVKLLESRDSRSWRTLAELTLARLITFNKRRASEPAKMLVEKFLTRPDWKDANSDMMQTFTPLEKQLLNKMDLIEVLGKKNRKVPVLLTKSMSSAIEALISVRTTVGIPQENPYVFACGQGYLRGCEVLRNVVKSCNLKNPELITSTRMRKYMATVSQVFNLSNIELEEIARHMGHELTVHRKTYRLQEDVTELAKVSKLLLTVEKGMAHSYAGMSIDDIRLEDLDDFDEENSCREKPTDEQNVSSSSEQNLDDFDEKNSCQEKPTDEQNVSSSSDQSSVKPVKNKFDFSSDEDDMDTDFVPTADTEDEDSSDSDIERKKPAGKSKKSFDTKKKREKQKRTRAIWSNEEKEIIKTHLLPKVKATRRPPQKSDVLKVTQMSSLLARKAWKHIKYQAWSFFQQEKKAEKKMINEMFS